MPFVLDASVALSWCFEDQVSRVTESALEKLGSGDEAYVPSVWPLEVANAIVVAERRKILTAARATAFLEQLAMLPIRTEASTAGHVFDHVISLARKYRLSAYDASYLDLALRMGLPIATVDRSLRTAAQSAGVPPA